MRPAALLIPLAILVGVFGLAAGTACGTGYREGGFPGCGREMVRQLGVLMGTGRSSSPSFASSGGAISAGPTTGALVASGAAAGRTESWRRVTFWSGRGNKDTEPFLVARPEWRIVWSAKGGPTSAVGTLRVGVYEGSGDAPLVVVDASQPGSDTVDVAKGPGRYRLKIESANADWTVQVEER